MQRCSLIVTPDVVFPDVVVEKVMEVEVLEVLELASGRREQLFAYLYMGIHGSTYVKEQEDLHSVVPLWNHLDIEQPSIFRCGADRIIKIELVCRARARKLSQSTKRDFNVPSANFDTVIEVFKVSAVPYFDRLLVFTLSAHANTFRMKTVVAERRCTASTNPLITALVTLLLLL